MAKKTMQPITTPNSRGKRMVYEDLIKKLMELAYIRKEDIAIKLKGITNITSLTDDELNDLTPGDIVLKKTGNEEHTYIVTSKEDKHGICLSYFDAGYTETVSYDYVDNAWVYNSTDVVTPKKYYKHILNLSSAGASSIYFKCCLVIINDKNTAMTLDDIKNYLESINLDAYNTDKFYDCNGQLYASNAVGHVIGISRASSNKLYLIYTKYVTSISINSTATFEDSYIDIVNDLIVEL